MHTAIDPTSDRPVFRQIADWLRDQITIGELAPGAQLPSESQLVSRFSTTRTTARQALAVLKAEGLIVSQHGRGAFVRHAPTVVRRSSNRPGGSGENSNSEEMAEFLGAAQEKASPAIAKRLGLRANSKVLVRRHRYLLDGQPVELATSYLPATFADRTMTQAEPGRGGIYARLEEHGHPIARFTEEITARMPTPNEVRDLHLDPGIPVLAVLRTAYDPAGRAVEVSEGLLAADRFVLEYELPVR